MLKCNFELFDNNGNCIGLFSDVTLCILSNSYFFNDETVTLDTRDDSELKFDLLDIGHIKIEVKK